ncbi:CpsB/CapC family capsule biosynthesis tyrosine phosphatase [Desulfoluna sp.]|uniref:tyrosine-protein phosphatase n=1 Tax=Desulfoluna sp. TaxID=2045199 RepID=UPI0026393F5F|nr:CpsB/CapC family capsule biosynthesis tyrosine phosphatase [Desulfoluna sp.]
MLQTRWTDIHCHILPGVDDGSQDMEESITMAALAEKGGTARIVATFHAGVDLLDAQLYLPLIQRLNERLQEKGIDIMVLPGAEILAGFYPENLADFALNGSRYVLVEFPGSHLPKAATRMLRAYQDRGFHPIIAHPERNPTILRDPRLLFQMVEETGALVQITADSIAGTFGRDIASCARYLLKKGAVDIMASDAHDRDYRTPHLGAGLKAVTKIVGEKEALKLVSENPLAVINDKELER